MYTTSRENRLFSRVNCKLKISIKDADSDIEAEATSTDISAGGLGIESYEELKIGSKLELWIHTSDGLKPIHRYGRLVWRKRINSMFYKGGIRFESLLETPMQTASHN